MDVSARCAAGLSGCAPCRLCRHGHSAPIPHAFAPAALRASLASRGSAQGPSPPHAAWRPCESAEPACTGSARPAHHHNGRGAGYALTCCGRLCKCVPSSMLAVRHHHVTTGDSRTHRPALLWSFHTTPQACRRRMQQDRSRFPLA